MKRFMTMIAAMAIMFSLGTANADYAGKFAVGFDQSLNGGVSGLTLNYWMTRNVKASVTIGAEVTMGEKAKTVLDTAVGFGYAVPMTVFFIVPDVVVYMFAGHEALPGAMAWYVPVALAMTYERVGQAIRDVHELSRGMAYLIALAPAIAQALPMAMLVR